MSPPLHVRSPNLETPQRSPEMCMQTLETDLNNGVITLKSIINRYPITLEFCKTHIFGPTAELTIEEDYFLKDESYVHARQPHLSMRELRKLSK